MLESSSENVLEIEVIESLNEDELKSALFLLQDYLNGDYLAVVKKDPPALRDSLKNLFMKQFEVSFFMELFGSIRRYDILRRLGSCCHVFKRRNNGHIKQLWKTLFELCEQLDDEDLKSLKKQYLGRSFWKDINCAEEFFSLTFTQKIFSERDLTSLREAFSSKTLCLNILEKHEEAMNYYPIRQPTENLPCGIALIINHEKFTNEDESLPFLEKREGSKVDIEKLQKLWKCFGFKVRVFEDLSDIEVLEVLDEICNEDHSSYDAFIMCYLSHGRENTLFASNNREIKIDFLVNKIANETRTLNGKPKCFFIQACQGESFQTVSTDCLSSLETKESEFTDAMPLDIQRRVSEQQLKKSPTLCDVYQVISTIPGYVSFRTVDSGSWFISALYEIMMQLGDTRTITHIITKVTESVTSKRGNLQNHKNCAQTPINSSTLCRELKFKKITT